MMVKYQFGGTVTTVSREYSLSNNVGIVRCVRIMLYVSSVSLMAIIRRRTIRLREWWFQKIAS